MWKMLRKSVGTACVLGLLVGGFTIVEPAVSSDAVLEADEWQFFISTIGIYCEGCCAPQSLCCDLPVFCED